jgi:hypothetical protein
VRRTCTIALVAWIVALSACGPTSTAPSTRPSETNAPPSVAPSSPSQSLSSPSPSASAATTTLASGTALPACAPGAPEATATVAFVAAGNAWALDPSGSKLTCLFAVADSGPFAWGPLGDRALLGGLEVKGVGDGPSLAPTDETYSTITWSRPTGKSIVYAPAAGTSLEKVHLDGTANQDVTPLPASTYVSVAYHPSGEAFVFVVEQSGVDSIWISSNLGKTPGRLVFTEEGTQFGAIGFEADGKHLLYAAQHDDNHADLHRIDVTDPTKAPIAWSGPVGPMILDIQPGLETGTIAWTAGTSCKDSVAMAQSPAGTVTAIPDAGGPTRAVGWLGATQFLVATGGCGERLDLSVVDVSIGSIAPLVSGVDAAAVRTPVPTPPARLPASVATLGSGFS